MTDVGEIASTLSRMAPPTVRTAVSLIDPCHVAGLHAAEAEQVSRAVPRRLHEFATGRHLLRSLIGEDVGIPITPRRAPLLPPGLVGSLAHDAEIVLGAVSRESTTLAIGVDVEGTGPMEPDVRDVVVRNDDADIDPRLAFVLKEATYKAWSSLGGRLLEFHDVRLSVDDDSFEAEVLPGSRVFRGHWAEAAQRWLGFTWVPASTSSD